MSIDRDLLVRYLRQRRELGEREVFLDGLTAIEAVTLLRPAPVSSGRPPGQGGPSDQGVGTLPTGGQDPRTVVTAGGIGAAAPEGERAGTGAREGAEVAAGIVAPATGPAVASEGTPAAAEGLRILGAEAAVCTRCRLHVGRRNVVFGEGNPSAELVVVGEAPGFEEDRTGRPFVGPAGKLLDLMLLSIGFPRESVYICNVLKCRPPDNRDPQQDEVAACSTFLHRQLESIAPRAMLAVGKFAAQTLTGQDVSIGQLRGRVHEYRGVPLVATYHPAFLLRSRQWTRAAWQDLQLLREVLDA